MIEIRYNDGRIEVRYRTQGHELVMTPDEMIVHIKKKGNGSIDEKIRFIVPFCVYPEVRDIAKIIDDAIECGARR